MNEPSATVQDQPIGKLHRDASDRLTYEIHKLDSGHYCWVRRWIRKRFELAPASRFVNGWNEVFQDFTGSGGTVGLEWDNWSGFIVIAKSPAAEPLVRSIGTELDAHPGVRARVRGPLTWSLRLGSIWAVLTESIGFCWARMRRLR